MLVDSGKWEPGKLSREAQLRRWAVTLGLAGLAIVTWISACDASANVPPPSDQPSRTPTATPPAEITPIPPIPPILTSEPIVATATIATPLPTLEFTATAMPTLVPINGGWWDAEVPGMGGELNNIFNRAIAWVDPRVREQFNQLGISPVMDEAATAGVESQEKGAYGTVLSAKMAMSSPNEFDGNTHDPARDVGPMKAYVDAQGKTTGYLMTEYKLTPDQAVNYDWGWGVVNGQMRLFKVDKVTAAVEVVGPANAFFVAGDVPPQYDPESDTVTAADGQRLVGGMEVKEMSIYEKMCGKYIEEPGQVDKDGVMLPTGAYSNGTWEWQGLEGMYHAVGCIKEARVSPNDPNIIEMLVLFFDKNRGVHQYVFTSGGTLSDGRSQPIGMGVPLEGGLTYRSYPPEEAVAIINSNMAKNWRQMEFVVIGFDTGGPWNQTERINEQATTTELFLGILNKGGVADTGENLFPPEHRGTLDDPREADSFSPHIWQLRIMYHNN